MDIKKTAFFIFFLLMCKTSFAENKLIAFFEQAPQAALRSARKEFSKNKSASNDALPQSTPIKTNRLPSRGGIPTLYAGYLNYGKKIQFPLRHASQKLYIVVTPSIKVVPRQAASVAYLSLDDQTTNNQETKNNTEEVEQSEAPPAEQDHTISTTATPGMEAEIHNDPTQPEPKVYLLEKKQDEKKVWYWSILEEEAPQNKKISPISLIIISNPNNIYIKTGDTIATEEAHLRLPTIYVLDNHQNEENLINFLDLSRYFEPIATDDKEEPEKVRQSILTN